MSRIVVTKITDYTNRFAPDRPRFVPNLKRRKYTKPAGPPNEYIKTFGVSMEQAARGIEALRRAWSVSSASPPYFD